MHIFIVDFCRFLLLKIIQDSKGGNSMGSTAKEDNIESITTFRIIVINIQTYTLALLRTRGGQIINERFTMDTCVVSSARKIIIQYLELF